MLIYNQANSVSPTTHFPLKKFLQELQPKNNWKCQNYKFFIKVS